MTRRASFPVLLLLLFACGDDAQAPAGGGAGAGPPATGGGGSTADGGAPSTGGSTSDGGSTTSSGGGGGEVDPWAGPVESLKELDLGDAATGAQQQFPIPDRVLGFTTLTEANSGHFMGIASLRPVGFGSVILNYEIPGTGLESFVGAYALSGGNPQSDLSQAFPVKVGPWSLRVVAEEGLDTTRSRIFVRRTLDGSFHGGVLDVHVYISPGSGANQSYVNGVLDDLFGDYYGPLLGIGKGTVTFATLPSSYDNVNSYDEYRQMLASSSTTKSAPAVNLFVVGDFSGDINNALGIAGGIPGSPMVHGLPTSGVAYTPTGNQSYDASVLAHEIGHLGGLFHTTEFQVTAFDALADTPQCPNINQMNPSNCPDVSNVMFPIAYGGSVLTTSQIRVLRGSALYRGILDAGGAPSPPLLPFPREATLEASTFTLPPAHAPAPQALSPLERMLHGHWCGHAGDVEGALAATITAADRAALRGTATDPDAFDVARGRAMSLLARTSAGAGDDVEVVALARAALDDPGAGRRLRIAALEAIADLHPASLDHLLTARAMVDPVVAERLFMLR